jgi:hypothetical protein
MQVESGGVDVLGGAAVVTEGAVVAACRSREARTISEIAQGMRVSESNFTRLKGQECSKSHEKGGPKT